MTRTEAPDTFRDERDGDAWSTGTHVEQPLGTEGWDQRAPSPAGRARDAAGEGRPPARPKEDRPREGGPARDEPAPPGEDVAARPDADGGEASPNDGDSSGPGRADGEQAPEGRGRGGDAAPETRPDQAGDERRDGADEPDQPPPPPSFWVFDVVGLLLAGLLAWGAWHAWSRHSEAEATRQHTADMVPQVRTVEAKREDKPVALTLPGQTEALNTANIYARATGYASERRADIGSRVRKGDLLLRIAAPDLDQQLAQAEAQIGQVRAAEAQAHAQVAQAEANVNLAKVTLARTATLTQRGYDTLQNQDNRTADLLSQQANLETARAGVKVAEANTKAQLATVDRLKALTAFEEVRAPFDGVVTVRNVEVGDLLSADSSGSSPMFTVARDEVIRVTLQVPQNQSGGVRDGLPATIEVPSQPGQLFRGQVTRSSVALLSSARTLDTEVDIPNPEGKLRPGLFVYVTVDIPREHPHVSVPSEALIFNQHGLQVATVADDRIALHDVKIDRDLGTTVELSEGLEGGEQVVLSPPAILPAGASVKVGKPEDADGKGKPGGDGKPKDGAGKDGSAAAGDGSAGKSGEGGSADQSRG